MMNDLRGKRFGRLIVLKDLGKRCGGHIVWTCICGCGNIHEAIGNNLVRGIARSCGCLRREVTIKKNWKHGDRWIRLYTTWLNMKNRCFGKNHHHYKYYGAKGIKVCSEWRNNFITFKSWALVNGYQGNLTIDRINPDGNYEPSNCQWLTMSENSKKAWRQGRYKNKFKKRDK